MAILIGEKPYETASSQKFPDTILHVNEAKKLIAATSMDAPKAWMKVLTEKVSVLFQRNNASNFKIKGFNSRNYKCKNAAEAAAYILDPRRCKTRLQRLIIRSRSKS